MGYGLFQGLNEAYDSYRGRERDIEDKNRRKFIDEQAKTAAKREGIKFERETEKYEYNVGLRTQQERAATLVLEGAERTATMDIQKLEEFMSPEEITNRKTQRTQELEKLKLDLGTAGLKFNDAQILHRANMGAERYREWKTEWMHGGTIEKLVENFNNDRDEDGKLIDSNDIDTVIGDETKGWTVKFVNGETRTFKNRDAVAIHLENMADPVFHQQYLLQQLNNENDLVIAAAKAKALLRENLLPRKKEWDNQTSKAVVKLYAQVFKEGFIEFGDEGAKQLQSIVASIADDIGAASEYTLVHSNVFERIGSLAIGMMDTDPESMRRKATELYEARPDTEFANGVKPKEGTPEYNSIIKNMMYQSVQDQMENLKVRVVNDILMAKAGGGFIVKDQEKPSGDTIPKTGLQRNVRQGTEDPLASIQVASIDDAGADYGPPPEPAPTNKGETTSSPSYKAKIAGLRKKRSAADQRKASLESKLGISTKDGPDYRKKIGTYVKSDVYRGLSIVQQEEILDQFEDALTAAQLRKARKALNKRKGTRSATKTPYGDTGLIRP